MLKIILLEAALLLMCACGGGDGFRITGEIPGIGTQNLNVVYYADGSVHSARTAVIDSKFMFDGASRQWTVVYFFTNSRALLGMVIIKNDENVDARFVQNDIGSTMLKGTKASELLAGWLSRNGDVLSGKDYKAINAAVEKFVIENKDNLAATVALMNYFHPETDNTLADSLFQLIDPKSRPSYLAEGWLEQIEMAGDSAKHSLPDSLYFLDSKDNLRLIETSGYTTVLYSPGSNQRMPDTDRFIESRLKALSADSLKLQFFEIDREVNDTLAWKQSVINDELKWTRLWHPFNSLTLPWTEGEAFIVSDSTGRIIYTGMQPREAFEKANRLN